ncbi:hypothetical protein CFK38_03410 [Brachybacterium vulturis]|uniref:Uncharacterized protein n=1 Tax=Brachybacterium vulturis TaxID=2017484 RepID=A0A291GKC2_9MICO|nr:hypothetical protein [Brachybacterium vulturis]ATG50671.1 hypothetical protein CFK38_03410 [Brachybacterium vulturis]
MSTTTQSPSAEPTITQRDMLGAMEVLATTEPEPSVLLILTDEELMGLDGASALELLGSPYLDQEVVDRTSSAAAALRSLTARGLVRPGGESVEDEGELVSGPGDAPRRAMQLDRRLAGVVTLRRIPDAMVTTSRTLNGGSTTLAHYLFPRGGVLEEYVSIDGFHHFSVPELETVPDRIRRFVDPFEAAGEDGDPETVTAAEVTRSIDVDDARAVSVLTAVAEGAGRQATLIATSDRVRVLDHGPLGEETSPHDELQISDVSSQSLLGVIDVLIPRPADVEDEATPGS